MKRSKLKKLSGILMIIMFYAATLGFSQSIDKKDFNEEITSYVNQYLQHSGIPGVNIAVTSSEEVLYQNGFGIQEIGTEKSMMTNIPSPIGSLTKSFTALALLQQVEKGVISLDDKVIHYIPWYKTFDKEKSDQMTIEMLLNNSSGLPHNVNFSTFFQNNPSMDFEKAIRAHKNVTLYFEPGTSYSYSNEGFMIAGYILELVTGMSYVDYVEKNIFKPLEMSQTTTSIQKLLETDFIYGHLANVDEFLPAGKIYSGIMIPAGSELISTVSDLSHYAQMLMNKGAFHGKRLLDQALFEKYLQDGINPFKMYHLDFSYQSGWIHFKDTPIMMHMGQTFSASSIMLIDKEKNIAVSILCNVPDVVNGKDSIYNLAFYLLQLFTNQDYSFNLKPNLPLLQEDTSFIQQDPKILGQYRDASGLTKAIITETASGTYEGVFQSALGISSYELSFVTVKDVYAKNVGSEIMIKLIRSTANDVIGFTHPNLGSFERITTTIPSGYHNFKNDFGESILPDDYTLTDGVLSNGLVVLHFEERNLITEELPTYSDEIFEKLRLEKKDGKVIESSTLREFTLNGLTCYEKIQIIDDNSDLNAFVFYNIQDRKSTSSITIYGTIPFELLTEVRFNVIQVFIKNFTSRTVK